MSRLKLSGYELKEESIEKLEQRIEACKRDLRRNPYTFNINMVSLLIKGNKDRGMSDYNTPQGRTLVKSFKQIVERDIIDGKITLDFLLYGDASKVDAYLSKISFLNKENGWYNTAVFNKHRINGFKDLKWMEENLKTLKNIKVGVDFTINVCDNIVSKIKSNMMR